MAHDRVPHARRSTQWGHLSHGSLQCSSSRHGPRLMHGSPLASGFAPIEAAMRRYQAAVPVGEWYYVNVYDPADDTTPLNWWLD
jgi:hypothetical protein